MEPCNCHKQGRDSPGIGAVRRRRLNFGGDVMVGFQQVEDKAAREAGLAQHERWLVELKASLYNEDEKACGARAASAAESPGSGLEVFYSLLSWECLSELIRRLKLADPLPISRDHFDLLAHAVISARTLGDVIQRTGLFLEMTAPFPGRLRMVSSQGPDLRLVLCDTVDANPEDVQLFGKFWCLTILRWLEWLGGEPIPVHRIEFVGEPHPLADLIPSPYDCEPVYGAAQLAVHVPREVLEKRIVRHNADLEGTIEHLPYHLFLTQRDRIEDIIHVIMLNRLMNERRVPDMEEIAHELHCSSATLRRRLLASGLSYEKVKDDVRRGYAENILRQSQGSVEDMANLCGYSDAISFRRAFRRWTGMSPRQFRRISEGDGGEDVPQAG